MSDNSDPRELHKGGNPVIQLLLLALIIVIAVVVILMLLGPTVGNIFSNLTVGVGGWIRPLLGF